MLQPMNKPFSPWHASRLVWAGLALLATTLVAAVSVDEAELSRRWEKVSRLSQRERDRLQQNYALFERLSNEEKGRYRALHEELTADAATGGRLLAVLETYHEWLLTIEPGEREDIRQADTIAKKIELIRKAKEAQEDSFEAIPTGAWLKQFVTRFSERGPAMGAEDVARVMGLLEQGVPPEAKASVANLTGVARYRAILQTGFKGMSVKDARWPAPGQVNAAMELIGEPPLKKLIETRSKEEPRRITLMTVLLRGIALVLAQEFDRALPSREARSEFFANLPASKRDELMQLPHSVQEQVLIRLYAQQAEGTPLKELLDIHQNLEMMVNPNRRGRMGPPPFGPPPGGSPPGGPPFGPPGGGPGGPPPGPGRLLRDALEGILGPPPERKLPERKPRGAE